MPDQEGPRISPILLKKAEMSKTFSACQTFGLTNLENLPDRMKTCQTEYKLYKLFHILINFCKHRL